MEAVLTYNETNRARIPRWSIALVSAALLAGALTGCGGGNDDASKADSTTPASPTEPTASVEPGTTPAGTKLDLGEKAVVRFKPNPKHNSLISLDVTKVKQGKTRDLSQFDLSKDVKRSNVYYVDTVVKNKGPDNLSGQSISLYGVVSDNLVVPPVEFGSTFGRCDYRPLPTHFTEGKKARVCIVMFAPHHGKIRAVQWRAADNSEPVTWALS